MTKRFVLADCNNFYVSCERVFDPTLQNKPVVVLGSNDACIIARSNEAKALGIPMGAPTFEWQEVFKKHKVIVYSANFALYGDMSDRVMQTLTSYAADIEIYSVDEAFLFVPSHLPALGISKVDPQYYLNYAYFIKNKVKQDTGIPVSIGIGPTKTLAKIANRLAKKNPHYRGAFDITDQPAIDTLLASVAIGDVWGIGYRYAKFLQAHKIVNARDFKYADEQWVRKHLTIVGLKTLLELRGQSCSSLEDPKPKQSIGVSRSFGKKVTDISYAQEALAHYVACAAAKLRAQSSLATHITVFAITNRYHDPKNYFASTQCQLPVATDYTPHLVEPAHRCLKEIFKPGFTYKKVGILLAGFVPRDFLQMSILVPHKRNTEKETALMRTLDRINNKWGRNRLFFAGEGVKRPWKMHQAKKSACFTTSWHELLTITI